MKYICKVIWRDKTGLPMIRLQQSHLRLQPRLVSDHLSWVTSFLKYQKIAKQIIIFGTSCETLPLLELKI